VSSAGAVMNSKIILPLDDFDISNLPENYQDKNSPNFKEGIKEYIESDYGNLGHFVSVKVTDENIEINQDKKSDEKLEYAVVALQQGHTTKGKEILNKLLSKYPKNASILFNLGMIYSDQGDLQKSIMLLDQAVKSNSEHAHAWIALSVAYMRNSDIELATKSANTAVQIDSNDPYVLRTAGTLLAQAGNNTGALLLLEKAVQKSPNDSISLYSLSECLRVINTDENEQRLDELYKRIIELDPSTPQAKKAKEYRRKFANKKFREVSDLRPDAVMYCLDALNKFESMSTKLIAGVAMEAATLGQSGLNVNNPDSSYQLRTIPGEYSGLNVVCILHTAIQKISPGDDSGFDVQKEYEEALKLFNS